MSAIATLNQLDWLSPGRQMCAVLGGMAKSCTQILLRLVWRKSMWHGRAHLMISSAVMDAGLCLGLSCVTYASHEIRWKSRLRFESISWVADSDRRKGLQQTQTIWNFNGELTALPAVLEPSMPKWFRNKELKYQQNLLPIAKKYASTCEHETSFLSFCQFCCWTVGYLLAFPCLSKWPFSMQRGREASAIWKSEGILKAEPQGSTKPLDLALLALLEQPRTTRFKQSPRVLFEN